MFRGPSVNNNKAVPRQLTRKRNRDYQNGIKKGFKGTLWKQCISTSWAEREGQTKVIEKAPDAPKDWTIFALKIPNADLDTEDLGWVGDDEEEL